MKRIATRMAYDPELRGADAESAAMRRIWRMEKNANLPERIDHPAKVVAEATGADAPPF